MMHASRTTFSSSPSFSSSFALVLLIVASLHGGDAIGAVRFVRADAPAGGDGASWATAFSSPGDALGVAVSGDEIWVAQGTYVPGTDAGASFELVDGVALYGGFAGDESSRDARDVVAYPTILSGELGGGVHSHSVLRAVAVGPATVVDGFTVTRGGLVYAPSEPGGGALRLLDASPTIRDVEFVANGSEDGAPYGGAVRAQGGAPSFERVRFVQNLAAFAGGAVHLDNADFGCLDCEFEDNRAAILSGAIHAQGDCDVTLVGGRFLRNSVDDVAGVMVFSSQGALRMRGVEFADHSSSSGGPSTISVSGGSEVRVEGCRFLRGSQNWPGSEGGALSLAGVAQVLVLNSLFFDNFGAYGGALHLNASQALVVNSTFVRNEGVFGGGFVWAQNGSALDVVNSIVWSNTSSAADPVVSRDPTSTARFTNSLVQSSSGSGASWNVALGEDLGGNIDADPDFVDELGGDLRLLLTSPAIEGGVDPLTRLPAGTVFDLDLDGNPRRQGSTVDIGAFEFSFDPCPLARIEIGPSWDGPPLQEILDEVYGAGAIDVANDYAGARCGDPIQAYWFDATVDAWLVREISSSADANVFGWYREDFSAPSVDGSDDGVLFDGSAAPGASTFVSFADARRFGFYLDPNGPDDGTNAPQPERFYTNRVHDDEGSDGTGVAHQPAGGDVQCLIFDVTHLRQGVPTYVLAWEDSDAGSPVSSTPLPGTTDNDYNDLVVEIRADSPVSAVVASVRAESVSDGVRVAWELVGASDSWERLDVERRSGDAGFVVLETIEAPASTGQWIDTTLATAGRVSYRVTVWTSAGPVRSEDAPVDVPSQRGVVNGLARAVPNPFNPRTAIEFTLARRSAVSLGIYDLAGRQVRELVVGEHAAGSGRVEWDGTDVHGRSVASGVYLVRMITPIVSDPLRVLLLK